MSPGTIVSKTRNGLSDFFLRWRRANVLLLCRAGRVQFVVNNSDNFDKQNKHNIYNAYTYTRSKRLTSTKALAHERILVGNFRFVRDKKRLFTTFALCRRTRKNHTKSLPTVNAWDGGVPVCYQNNVNGRVCVFNRPVDNRANDANRFSTVPKALNEPPKSVELNVRRVSIAPR